MHEKISLEDILIPTTFYLSREESDISMPIQKNPPTHLLSPFSAAIHVSCMHGVAYFIIYPVQRQAHLFDKVLTQDESVSFNTMTSNLEVKSDFNRKIHVKITHARMEGKQSQMPILWATSVNVPVNTKENTVQSGKLVRRKLKCYIACF